ncbi:cyclin domain containing protein [Purpureocillium lavendulum]|uniref:Cyclin domain containing protein n=1 Tax=Purpureocillium lavendulum TaxID=1247861 RepID=A0AB34FYG9_9HYPO|nr:cyclin domain containing protein [Purpureocillium lavendulum]
MAARPGEENVATLFGDIHYFYGPPEVRPRHHRFDRGSYVYLFENATERRCRIEVANNAGTEDQDAFDGFLDQTRVRYSYNHHCMVSLVVADAVNQSEWHLPTYDPRNENKYHYKLQSLDIYFWTQTDALRFVNGVRRVLPPAQVEVLDEPGPPAEPVVASSIVQRLERVAVTDPQYGGTDAASRATRAGPTPPSQATAQGSSPGGGSVHDRAEAVTTALPPPPPPPPPPAATTAAANFVPMAYNPAAPAAPEAIRHREKTPPPDEDPLNPLAVAVAYDYQKQPFTPGIPPPGHQGQITSPGLPPPQFAGPPSHPGMQRAATMPVHAGLASPQGSNFPASPGFAPPPPPPQPATTQATPAVTNSSGPLQSPSGFTNYTYTHQQGPVQQPSQDYSIHQQVYRPAADARAAQAPYHPKQDGKGRLEENAGRLERGVTGMLKKFEKKFG